jgi:predicted TIM-barrel fold metal-dependent hydrolase
MTHTEELIAQRKALAARISNIKSEIEDIDAALAHIAWPAMQERLLIKNAEYGDYKLNVDGVEIQGTIRKTVKWDNDKLKAVAAKLPDAHTVIKAELSIPEENFKKLEATNHPMLSEIILARQVKLSPFSIKVVENKD